MTSEMLPRNEHGRFSAMETTLRFEAKFIPEPNSGCWLWVAGANSDGRGLFYLNGKSMLAPRASWVLHIGPIPDGMDVCHKCDVAACVNPDHLWLGTAKENLADMVRKNRHYQRNKPWLLARGERNGASKLTEEKVLTIREKISAGQSIRSIAREFGMSEKVIGGIRSRRLWNHVPEIRAAAALRRKMTGEGG